MKPKKKSTRAGKEGWRQRFIDALGQVPNVTFACQQAHIDRHLPYNVRKTSKVFRNQWDAAVQRGIELLELQAWKRASVGVKRGVWMKGSDGAPMKVEDISEYSDTLAIFLLKAHAPAKYRETYHTQISGPNGKPISVEVEDITERLSEPELRRIVMLADRQLSPAAANGNGNGHTNGSAHSNGGNGSAQDAGPAPAD